MIRFAEVILDNSEEISNNLIWWSGSIDEEEIIMSNSFVFKMLFIVFLFIKSDYPRDINVVEDVTILVWVLSVLVSGVSGFDWSHESDELAWDDPVEITVFDSLVVLVFFNVESSEVIPVEFNCVFQSLENLEKSTIVEAVTFGGISVMLEELVVWFELFECIVGRHFQNNYHEGTHQESSVHHFGSWF